MEDKKENEKPKDDTPEEPSATFNPDAHVGGVPFYSDHEKQVLKGE